MASLLRLLVLVIAVAALQGCSSFRGAPLWDPTKPLNTSDPVYDGYVTRFYTGTTAERRMAIRDEYITVRMGQVDRAYGNYKQELHLQRTSSAVGIDAAMLTLAAIAATVSDPGTAVGAAALAGVVAGSRASFDKNVFFDQALPAILSQMDAQRSVIRARLFAGMMLTDVAYRLNDADSDLNQYQQAGTVYGAIAAITSQAGQAQAAAAQVLRDRLPNESEIRSRLLKRGFRVEIAATTDTTGQLQKCFLNGGLDPTIKVPLETWFAKAHPPWAKDQPANSLPKVPPSAELSNFMSVQAFETLRQQAFEDAALGPLLKACNNPIVPTEAPK